MPLYRKVISLIMVMSLSTVFSGCAGYQQATATPADFILQLHENLNIESGRARVFLQNGKVTKTNELQTYEPSCDFEVRQVARDGLKIEILAGDFIVTRFYYAAPSFTSAKIELHQEYAQIEYPNTTYLTVFDLLSQSQPDVMRLNCKIWSIDVHQRYLTQKQLRDTLGNIVSFINKNHE